MISRCFSWIRTAAGRLWNAFSLIVLLSVAATVPVLQLASLGYMLESSGRVARGMPVRRCFPGSDVAGKIVACGLWLGLSWLPVWFLTDLAYSSELIHPNSIEATRLRVVARIVAILWVLWGAWAIFRGGRWWHFLWPAPIRFLKTAFRRSAWRDAEDRLWNFMASLKIPRLLKIGFFGALGAMAWLMIPSLLIIIALTNQGNPALVLVGLVGALGMWWTLMYLPFLPVHMASQNRWRAVFDRRGIRAQFRKAPLGFLIAVLALVALAIPLYLLRIEPIPEDLWWILSLFFVVLMFPAKLLAGWALRRSHARDRDAHWVWRWMIWLPMISLFVVYIGVLYVAKFALWEGSSSILFQHAFLPPVPFYIR